MPSRDLPTNDSPKRRRHPLTIVALLVITGLGINYVTWLVVDLHYTKRIASLSKDAIVCAEILKIQSTLLDALTPKK